jgi:hypothetical protein
MTEDFGLEVDGRMKTIFPTLAPLRKGIGHQNQVSHASSQGV